VGLTERTNMANNWGADYFISIHANANENPQANGTETLYHPNSTKGKALATEVQEQLILQLKRPDRGIIPRSNLAVLRLTNMPAILAELAFISNPVEAELLANPEFRQAAAQGIADGLTQFLKQQ
ncbi:MAG: N-acetylmuramoyl-L-alanine amidase, partial [Defluviitaleaceae bacterium]|nr:N-acetylmuramoyl-L-alanine amidase [Defluviitaleaceae bacterium]